MDIYKPFTMIILILAILSTGNSASICDQHITPLNRWDPYYQYTLLERFANTPCKNSEYSAAYFQEAGCCSYKKEQFSWIFAHKKLNETTKLTCYVQKRTNNVPLATFKFPTGKNLSEICELQTSSLIKTISKTNTLQMDFFSINSLCMICLPAKNSSGFFTHESIEDNSDEKGKPSDQQCECGKSKKIAMANRIFNGTDVTNIEKYPWLVTVDYIYKGNWTHLCVGSVITKRHVLTAAHCATLQPKLTIQLGVTHLEKEEIGKRIKVVHKVRHEKFRKDITAEFDIAVLVLEEEIPDNFYMPICIPNISLVNRTDQLTVLGFGLKGPSEPQGDTEQLKKAHIRVIAPHKCERIYGRNQKDKFRFNKTNQICTFSAYHSVCAGDSGGPWMYVDPQTDRYNLVGITSYWVELCDVLPNAQTAVHFYYKWIKQIIALLPAGFTNTCNISI